MGHQYWAGGTSPQDSRMRRLKTFASVMYAFCIYMLLEVLGVDLAIVFGLITFLFNFVWRRHG